jgi:cytochrome b involved in lipid metabolism
VYDLTSFIPQHPGGERNILKICGKDGTAAFMGQHGGEGGPESTLAKHYLGAFVE